MTMEAFEHHKILKKKQPVARWEHVAPGTAGSVPPYREYASRVRARPYLRDLNLPPGTAWKAGRT